MRAAGMFGFFEKKQISSLVAKLPREDLLRRSRILIIDDEKPEIIGDLKAAGFAVDYVPDINSKNMNMLEKQLYDLILLDFGQVGQHFGADEGLSLLKHIKRVNPAVVVYTYTSKALKTEHADFYRNADATLAKDAGIQESLQKIEDGLRKAHSLQNVWMSLLAVCDIKAGSTEDLELQNLLVRGLYKKSKIDKLKEKVLSLLTSEEAKKIGLTLVGKAVELGIKSYLGA